MLPVSGAEQLKASGAIGERPMISQSGAYSRFVSPAPRPLSGRKRFQRPRSRAFALLLDDRGDPPARRLRVELVVEDLLVRVDVLVHEVRELLHVHLRFLRVLEFHVGPPLALARSRLYPPAGPCGTAPGQGRTIAKHLLESKSFAGTRSLSSVFVSTVAICASGTMSPG